jgi:17beta-estradiol 17-dehydrogenase / very-long-chain 3-oxoacyl-CoA reductase
MFGFIISFNYFLAWVLGIYTFVHCTCFIVRMLIRNYVRKSLDLPTRYGKGSWAVVTGATGGIGEAYCTQLAKLGFNIVLFGRSQDKLEESEKRVKEVNNNVKTKLVCADLGTDLSAKFYQDIYDQVKDLDISILINNAGWTDNGFQELIPIQKEIDNYRVTAASPAMLTRSLINKFLERKEKSALINVSSVGQNMPAPYYGTYTASKRFVTLFSYHIHDNYKNKVDVQDLQPGWVSTNLAGYRKGSDTISSDKCVQTSLRDLGQELSCHPVIVHSIFAQMMHTLYRHFKPLYRMKIVGDAEKLALRTFMKDALKNK